MVNNKKTKREKDIKSKLLAAVAMLLVSSIMMVSTTYAWFTLSTAPEVTGITTTIGSNGNLEIALSPRSGMGSDVGDADLTTGDSWLKKNLTWGNLVDMSDASYGLSELTLAPAQLVLDGTDSYTLGADAALATPSYGSDGRISALNKDAYIAGKALNADGTSATGYSTVDADYGVRAVGTASGLSAQESKFRTSVNAITGYANAAISAASNSLAANGDALAAMLVTHAAVDGEDTNDYAQYAPALKALTDDLVTAAANIDEALRAALAASAAHISDETKFEAAINAIEGKTDGAYNNTIAELVAGADTYGFTVPSQFNTILTARDEVVADINTAAAAAAALETSAADGANWSEVSPVLNNLMNISGDIKVSGQDMTAIKQAVADMNVDFLLGLAQNCQIELGAGSGVYYDLAVITGNITAKVPEVPVNFEKGDWKLNPTLKNVIIKTTVASTATQPYLPVMKTAMAANPPAKAEGATAVLDAYYGYVIDLMVRTNAAGSNLLLQPAPAQRVYADSANEATQGKGATVVFTTTDLNNVGTLTNLANSIRVVFFDPTHDDAVFGLAKVTSVVTTETPTKVTGEDGTEVDGTLYTITGTLELCEIKAATTAGLYVAGEKLTSQALCPLSQNIPQAISALVYLDGEDVTSADVLAKDNVVGALNLQFASDAELQPMDNSELFKGSDN